MKYFTIAPLKHLDLVADYPYHMVIGPYLRDKTVFQFYKNLRKQGAQIMLDNGAFEFKVPMEDREYLKLINRLRPQYVVLPDVWKDSEATIERSERFLDLLAENNLHGKVTPIGVPHGSTILEYVNCFERLAESCDLIGLTVAEWNDHHAVIRPWFAENWSKLELPKFHLLGLWSVLEISRARTIDKIVSVDCSLPFKLAIRGEPLIYSSFCEKPFNFHATLPKSTQNLAKENLKRLAKFCDGGSVD